MKPQNIPKYDFSPKWAAEEGFQLYELKRNRNKQLLLPQFSRKTNVPHRHNFYEVFFIFQGGGQHEIDFQTFGFYPKSIHVIAPGRIHQIALEVESQGYFLAFTESFFALNTPASVALPELSFFKPQVTCPILPLNNADFSYFERLLENLIQDMIDQPERAKQILGAYLNILLFKAQHLFEKQFHGVEEKSADQLVNSFKELIEKHFREKHSVKDYAPFLAVTPSHLNRVVKSVTEQTAGEHILNRLILEAKRLMLFSNMTNKEIAFHLQFNDPSYFSRLFRKKTGMTPSLFRVSMRKKYQQ